MGGIVINMFDWLKQNDIRLIAPFALAGGGPVTSRVAGIVGQPPEWLNCHIYISWISYFNSRGLDHVLVK